jgi:hypothetical protein
MLATIANEYGDNPISNPVNDRRKVARQITKFFEKKEIRTEAIGIAKIRSVMVTATTVADTSMTTHRTHG